MYFSSGLSDPCSMRAVTRARPGRPRLVKIWITPVAASDPYSVLAAPPFVISTRSMSEMRMSAQAEDCSPPVQLAVISELSIRTPST